jgi:hypothetical protein
MKKTFIALAISAFLVMTVGSVYAFEVFSTPSETISWNSAKAYNGYTTITTTIGGQVIYLIDMEGRVVHTWPSSGYKLMPNGNLFSGFGQGYSEMDWDGNYAWGPWEMPDPKPLNEASFHHDSWWMHDATLDTDAYFGNIFWKATNEEVQAAGGDPSIDYEYVPEGTRPSFFGGGNGRSGMTDAIWEVRKDTGEMVWEWKFLDHTIQDRNPAWPNYVGQGMTISDYPGKCDIFWQTDASAPNGDEGMVQDWHHCNSLNYNEELDLIVINAKHWSEFFVIDHGGTMVPGDFEATKALAASDAGDFLYRFGNPSAYKQGDAPSFKNGGHHQMYGSHNIHWIDMDTWPGGPTLNGMGNFLIFNNDCFNPNNNRSEILEINPFLGLDGEGNVVDTGWFVNPPEAGYVAGGGLGMGGGARQISNQIVWSFTARNSNSFYSGHISGCQRLPNGNTLVCSGTQGHLFEVTEDGEVVWDYVVPNLNNPSPIVNDTMAGAGTSPFRVQRYGPEYPGLAGRDLTPMGTIVERGRFEKLQDKLEALTTQ